jgi:RecA-family ATPase
MGGARKERRTSNGTGTPMAAVPHGRVPPHNAGAEQSLLGGILLDREAPLRELSIICSAADFYVSKHRKIFEGMLSLLEDDFPVDRVSLTDRLSSRGDLEEAGGVEYLELLDKIVPAAANLAYYAKIIHEKARARRLIEAASSIAQLGYEQHGDIADFIAESEKRIQSVTTDGESKVIPLRSRIMRLSRDGLRKSPPSRRYMLKDANTGRGVYLQAVVGLFAAAGGTGKSSAFGQLAVALTTGLTWFGPGGWVPAGTMRVLLLAGEDDELELDRRIHFAARDIGAVSDESLDLIARNLHAIPLAGYGCALTADDSFSRSTLLPETAFAVALRELAREEAARGTPYGCILIDPLSRFAGFDTEKDNASATHWIQVVETFTKADCGRPSVLAAHHTKKRNGDFKGDSIDLIRGASALKDGARWAAVLEQQKRTKGAPDLLTLRIEKANGVAPQREPLILCRPENQEGVLRIATPAEVSTNQKLVEAVQSQQEMIDDVRTQVLSVMEQGRAYSRKDLARLARRRPLSVGDAVNQLLTEGLLQEPRRGVLKLNSRLDLASGSRGSQTREPISPAAPLPGSAVPASPPLSCFKQEGSREPSETEAAIGPNSLHVVRGEEEKPGTGNRSGNRSAEPPDGNP